MFNLQVHKMMLLKTALIGGINMRKIVLSGINLDSGGTLTIYRDMINQLFEEKLYKSYDIVCFVYDKELFPKEYYKLITFIEVKAAKKSYIKRFYYEYFYFYKFSLNNDIYLWISVHDMTPRVKADRLYTYCHNPMPFYKPSLKELRFEKKLFLFSLFYKYIYAINIKRNTYVVVQQEWIRKEFKKLYNIDNILVAQPNKEVHYIKNEKRSKITNFIYASQATFFKNFEVLCEATQILQEERIYDFRVLITLSGVENAYSKWLYQKYKSVKCIEWIGFLPQDELFKLYGSSDCLVFPSKLETWGLPISEYKNTNKPIIVSDLPYAHETVGDYCNAAFFEPDNASQLAVYMKKVIRKESLGAVNAGKVEEICINGWREFWRFTVESEL